MAEQNRAGRARRVRGRGRGFVLEEDEQPRERDLRDIEIQEQRRRIQDLERQLAQARLVAESEEEEESEDSPEEEGEDENPFGVLNQGRRHRDRPENRPSFQNFGMKIEIPEFEGRAHADDFIDWLHTVERVFDIRELTENQKVKLVAIKLRKHASIWWEHVRKQRTREGKSKIETWVKMKKLLQKKILPAHYRQEAFIDYHNLRQREMTVEQYVSEFDRLRMRCDVAEEDEQTIARFLAGLRTDISDVVQLTQYWSYEDVCRLSLKVEGQNKRKSDSLRFSNRSSGRQFGQKSGGLVTNPVPTAPRFCNVKPKIKEGQSSGASKGVNANAARRCFKCQGLGYIASECLNRHIITFVEEFSEAVFDEYEVGQEDEAADDGDDVIYTDSGESLVVQRVLNVTIADDDLWLRHNIFHTKCTCKKKVCSMIIDGGSCENVVSTTMVEKLGLDTVDHPQPYKLSWLKKGNEVKVSKRCLIQFSIGKKYVDEVWCDVVPMDACHILLGRPWQFDRKTKHDGFCNTYTFRKDGETVTLGPTDLRKERKAQLLSRSEFR